MDENKWLEGEIGSVSFRTTAGTSNYPVNRIKRVLILSVSLGSGHVRAGEALVRAFGSISSDVEVRHIDLYALSQAWGDLWRSLYINTVTRTPEIWGWWYDFKHQQRQIAAFQQVFCLPFVAHLTKLISEFRPDEIVCVHYMPAVILTLTNAIGATNHQASLVLTDIHAHRDLLISSVNRYFTPFEQISEDLIALGVAPQMVTTSGIPVDPVFGRSKDKAKMRRKYKLENNRPTLLISAGGFGLLGVEGILTALSEVRHPLQVVAVCGMDKSLLTRVEYLAGQLQEDTDGRLKTVPVGFTDSMDEYMSAADIMIGKPGGLTTSEALCKGLPFIIVNAIPGQEEWNSNFLVSNNAAIRCSLGELAASVDELLSDQARLSVMRENARRLAHPAAAPDIVRALMFA